MIGQMERNVAKATSFQGLGGRELVWTVIGLQVTLLLAALDQTIVSTAMPQIIAQLHGFERYAWVTTVYMLTSTTAAPIVGKLSDMYGRKFFLLGSAVLFVLSSALCGMAGAIPFLPGDAMTQLILFRGIQGIGGGALMALAMTVIADIFPPAERGRYQGLFSSVWALASVVGPMLGGFITDHWTWRWVFYVNLPVGAVAVLILYLAFPHIKPELRRHKIDYAGALALISFMVPLLLGLTWAGTQGVATALVRNAFLVAAAMFALFIFMEVRAEEPIMPLTLFENPLVIICCASLFMMSMAMFGGILFVPLFMQSVIGVSAMQSGSLLMPMMLSITISSMICGQLITRMGRYKWAALLGLTITVLGMIMLSSLSLATTQVQCVYYMIALGVGLGFLMPVFVIAVQNSVPAKDLGAATASTQFFRSIGATVGSAIFGSILLVSYTQQFQRLLPPGLPPQAVALFRNPLSLEQQIPAFKHTAAHWHLISQILVANVKESLVFAIDNIFVVASLCVACVLVLNFFLKDVPLRRSHNVAGTVPAGH
jgi:EmrB/QacA subfamily drug resistance transporter